MIPTNSRFEIDSWPSGTTADALLNGWLHEDVDANYRNLVDRVEDTKTVPIALVDETWLDFIVCHPDTLEVFVGAELWNPDSPYIEGTHGFVLSDDNRAILLIVSVRCPGQFIVNFNEEDLRVYDMHT